MKIVGPIIHCSPDLTRTIWICRKMPKCDVNMEKYIYEDITEIKTPVGYFWLVMEMLTSLFQQKKMNILFPIKYTTILRNFEKYI